jgi:hypothetical protein
MDDTGSPVKATREKTGKEEAYLLFDAFQGLVLERTLTEEGRILEENTPYYGTHCTFATDELIALKR